MAKHRKFYKGERGKKLHEKHPGKFKHQQFEESNEKTGELSLVDLYYTDVEIDETPDAEMLIDDDIAPAPPEGSEVRTVLATDTPHIKIGILGDGYTAAEKEKFFTDAAYIVNGMFNDVAVAAFKSNFQVKGAFVPSLQSGAKHPNTSADCYTASPQVPVSNPTNRYGGTFDYGGTHRLLYCPNSSQITADRNELIADCPFVMIIVNTTYYGGSGGQYGICSVHASAIELMLHEFIGHSFGKLADEYGGSSCSGSVKANVSNVLPPPWPTTAGVPIPTAANTNCDKIGAYQGANYCNTGWWRPACNCKMRSLGQKFCAVCVKAIQDKIKSYIPAQLTVTIQPTAATINQGQSVTLTASGATSYAWSNGATTAAINVSPQSTTTYTVTGYKDGLVDTEQVTVTVLPVVNVCKPTVTPTWTAGLCTLKIATTKPKSAFRICQQFYNASTNFWGAPVCSDSSTYGYLFTEVVDSDPNTLTIKIKQRAYSAKWRVTIVDLSCAASTAQVFQNVQ